MESGCCEKLATKYQHQQLPDTGKSLYGGLDPPPLTRLFLYAEEIEEIADD